MKNITPIPIKEPSRLVLANAAGRVLPAEPPPAGQEQAFVPYPDGILFKYTPNPKRAGTFLLHDAAGQVVALCGSQRMADILAKGATLFFQLAQQKMAEAKKDAANEAMVAAMKADATPDRPYCEEQTPTVPV